MILDLGLPDMSGQDLLARWRAAGRDVPVVILSSRADEAGIVEALELGADDYVAKPFGMRELIARLRTALRHRLQTRESARSSNPASFRSISSAASSASAAPRSPHAARVRHPPRDGPARRQGPHPPVPDPSGLGGAADVHNLRVHVRALRQKIEPDPQRPTHVRTETGVGYRFRLPES